jgi:diguanylate cyclase (GGDEF)-like protein/PAS domain S-box-containing protein
MPFLRRSAPSGIPHPDNRSDEPGFAPSVGTSQPMTAMIVYVRRALSRLQLNVLLPVFALLLLAMLWTVVFYQIGQERLSTLRHTAQKSDSMAQNFQSRATLILQQVAQATQYIRFEFEQHDGLRSLSSLLASHTLPVAISTLVTVADADGKILFSNHDPLGGELAQRPSFRTHIAGDSGSLYIGMPVFNSSTRQWVLQMSRRLNHADGSFAGVVLVSMPCTYLTEFYERTDLGNHGSMSLLGADGGFRAVRVGNRMLVPNQPPVALASSGSAPERHQAMIAALSPQQTPDIVSYRQLKDFPLVAIVGIAEPEAYARFSSRRTVYLWSAVILSAAILGFFALLMMLSHRLQRSMRQAKEAQATFRAAVDGSLDPFCILKAQRDVDHAICDFLFVTVNQRKMQQIGKTNDELIGHTLLELCPDSVDNGYFAKCVQVADSGEAMEEECETIGADGNAVWWRHQRIPVKGGVAVTSRDISKRRRIENENRNNHNFLQSLIDYLPTLIFVTSLRSEDYGTVIVWNTTAEIVTGYPAARVLGKTPGQIFPARIASAYQKFSDRMLADPQVIDIASTRFWRFKGELLYLRTIAVPLFDADGKPEYLLGISVDITQGRTQEMELLTRQAELAAANDSSPLGLFHTDAAGHCTYVNHAYEKMSGLSATQALGDGWARSVHPQDRLKVFQGWGQAARTQQPYQGIYRFVHPDGRIVWASVKMAPILVNRQLQGFVGSVDDITAQRMAEKALLESEQHLRVIADALPALVGYVDAEQRFRFNNLAYERVFGLKRDAIRGKTLRELLGDTLYLRVRPYSEQALAGATVTFEIDEHRKGNYRCTDVTYTPQFDAEERQRVVGFHIMGHDVTAKKMHERRLVELTQTDSLTGLLNRAGFQKKLLAAMAESRVSHSPMAVLYMDIDHFKQVNDVHGHPVGDALLKSFVGRLLRVLRATDSVARLGGDEFTVIMEKLTRLEDAATICRKICEAMEPPFSLDETTLNVTASIGLAYYHGGPETPETLLKLADDMLYQAKKSGRNTYRIAAPGPALA